MKSTRVVLVLVVFALIAFGMIRSRSLQLAQNRAVLDQFVRSVELGDAYSYVIDAAQAICHQHSGWQCTELAIREDAPAALYLETPLELGASNWIACILFAEDKVSAIGVRTADSVRNRPPDAPADRVTAAARTSWTESYLWGSSE